MGAPLRLAGRMGRHWLTAIQRLDLALLIHTQHHRTGLLRRIEIKANDVATFSTKKGSVESLKFSCKCGLRPKARQMRTMAFWLSPLAAAMVRVLQWVAWLAAFPKCA